MESLSLECALCDFISLPLKEQGIAQSLYKIVRPEFDSWQKEVVLFSAASTMGLIYSEHLIQ
jgi:hypothetical protein